MAGANPLAIRFSDIESGLVFNPINGLASVKEGTLEEAIEIARTGDAEMNKFDFKKETFLARLFAKRKGQDPLLTADDIAVIHLYTQDSPFYQILNARLRAEDRAKLRPFFSILKLLLKALYKLPVFKGPVYRGVKVDLSKQYKSEDVLIWWAFSSSSSSLKTMETEVFFGADGERTMFHIKVDSGVKIKDYSAIDRENEILMLPGTCLQVDHVFNINGVPLIQMTELENPGLLDFTRQTVENKLTTVVGGINLQQQGGFTPSQTALAKDQQSFFEPKSDFVKQQPELGGHNLLAQKEVQSQVQKQQEEILRLQKELLQIQLQKEREQREKEQREKEQREKEQREKERECLLWLAKRVYGESKAEAKLPQLKQLTKLYLSNNKIGDEGVKALALALSQLNQLTTLGLSYNKIGDEGVKALVLALALPQLNQLTALGLSHNNIGDEGVKALALVLPQLNQLTTLYLSYNKIGDEGMKALAVVLPQLKHQLTTLDLSDNNIGDEGVKALALVLPQLNQLTELDLDGNNIGDEGMKALAVVLPQLNQFTTLGLSCNNIGAEGVKALALALPQLKQLTALGLSNNNIGDEGKNLLNKAKLPQLKNLHV